MAMMQLTDRHARAWEPSKRPPSNVPPRRPRATEESGLVQTTAAAEAAALALVVSVRAAEAAATDWTEEGRIHLGDYFWPKWLAPSTRSPSLPPAVLHLARRLLLGRLAHSSRDCSSFK